MCLNPYLKKMSSQINDCSYIWVNFYVIALTKAVYTNLVEFGTLHKEQVMQIIKEWEKYKLL